MRGEQAAKDRAALVVIGGGLDQEIEVGEVQRLIEWANDMELKGRALRALAENLMLRADAQGGSVRVGAHLLEVERTRLGGERRKRLLVDGMERLTVREVGR